MVRGAVGRGGAGKTLYTVSQLFALYKKGRDIIANTPLIDLRVKLHTPKTFWSRLFPFLAPNPYWVPANEETFGKSWAVGYIHTFDDLYTLDNCEVLIDEMGSWMRADLHKSIPEETRRFLAQDRREGVNLWWTHRTTRVFHEVLDNTAEIVRLERYGPFIVGAKNDPQTPDKKPLKTHIMVSPSIYDLYDTYSRVGSGKTGEGYGAGKRKMYQGAEAVAYYECDLPCVREGAIGCKIRLRPQQAVCMMRKYGPESIGLYRSEYSDVDTRLIHADRWFRGPVVVPGLVDA